MFLKIARNGLSQYYLKIFIYSIPLYSSFLYTFSAVDVLLRGLIKLSNLMYVHLSYDAFCEYYSICQY